MSVRVRRRFARPPKPGCARVRSKTSRATRCPRRMTYRDDLAALAARHDALVTEVAHKQCELDDATLQLAEAKRRASLPILDNVRVASPCKAAWADMVGDDRVRHCEFGSASVRELV